jgi:methionine-S-sulfoxide reductase
VATKHTVGDDVVAAVDVDGDRLRLHRRAGDGDAGADRHPLLGEELARLLGDLLVDAGEDPVEVLEHRDLGAQPAPDAAEFEADHARAHDDQVFGHLVPGERLGARADPVAVDLDALQRRHDAAGRQHDVLRGQRAGSPSSPSTATSPCRHQTAGALDPLDLVLLEQVRDAVGVRLHHRVLAALHRGEVELDPRHAHAVFAQSVARLEEPLARLEERLARDAPDAHAGASEGGLLLDAGDAEPQLRGADRGDVAAGSGTDDDDVVLGHDASGGMVPEGRLCERRLAHAAAAGARPRPLVAQHAERGARMAHRAGMTPFRISLRVLPALLAAALIAFALADRDDAAVATPRAGGPTAQAAGDGVVPGPGEAVAYFAGGCFWCTEADFEKLSGVLDVRSGFMGGHVPEPTYEAVVREDTGHREVVEVRYDPATVTYQQLLDAFWRMHDPTDAGGSFVDRGFSYSSAIYVVDDAQRTLAEGSKAALDASGKFDAPVATEIADAGPFWLAEDYHQDYYATNTIRYGYYRTASGRDRFIARVWADDTTVYALTGADEGRPGLVAPHPERRDAARHARPADVPGGAPRGDRTRLQPPVRRPRRTGHLRRRHQRRTAVLVARQVRLRHRLALVHAADRRPLRGHAPRPHAVDRPHGGPQPVRRRPPRPRLRRRPRTHGSALVHQRRGAPLRAARRHGGRGVRSVPRGLRSRGCGGRRPLNTRPSHRGDRGAQGRRRPPSRTLGGRSRADDRPLRSRAAAARAPRRRP